MDLHRAAGKILVAVRAEDIACIADAIGPEFDTVLCRNVKEAVPRLDADIGLILCGLQFDGGMIFDLLRHARSNPRTAATPFYSLVESRSILSPAILASVEMAARVLGANGTIHLADVVPDPSAHSGATARLRTVIRQLL